jgi:hypothetical protein
MKIIITEPQYKKFVVEELIPSPKYVVQIFNRFKEWLYKPDGLGLEETIYTILKPLTSEISDEDIKQYTKGVNILLKNGKISKKEYDNFLDELPRRKLVYDEDGNWDQINKLCTNYSDLSVLLTDFLFNSCQNGGVVSRQILEMIMNTKDITKIKDILKLHKDGLSKNLIKKYSQSPEDILGYVGNSIDKSKKGEDLENAVKETLLSPRYKGELLYQGGSGDFIDMIFSVDLIVKLHNGSITTIQVKSNEGQVNNFIDNKRKNRAVDVVIWPDTNEKIYNVKVVKTGETTFIK